MPRPKRLLSVDFDAFFPEKTFDPDEWPLYDWGHRDAGDFFTNELWYQRAEGFLINSMPLPRTTGLEKTFWNRFKYSPGCQLFLADSHMHIFSPAVFHGVTEVRSYDAHHDAGYRTMTQEQYLANNSVTCADWVAAYKLYLGIETKVFYPKWKTWAMEFEKYSVAPVERQFDDEKPVKNAIHRIFVCRSGGWTPPWIDDDFDAFVGACPVKNHKVLQDVKNRRFDMSKAEVGVQQQREMRRVFAEMHPGETLL